MTEVPVMCRGREVTALVDDEYADILLAHRWWISRGRKQPYAMGLVDGRYVLLHRYVWHLAHGTPPTGVVDHINGDTLDCRLANLRDVTRAVNRANTATVEGIKRTDGGRYRVTVRVGGCSITATLPTYDAAVDWRAGYLALATGQGAWRWARTSGC